MSVNSGKILTLDLGELSAHEEPLKDEIMRKYIGGKGLGAYLLSKNVPKGVDPLSKENVLVLAVGPLTGTRAPTANRYASFFKSPLTGIWCESYCGGHLAPQFKRAGYEALVIKGKAFRPTYVSIIEGNVKFHDASSLWGTDTWSTEDAVKKDIGEPKARVVTIGPAGENLVRFACACSDHYRQLGRGGTGAVMGSKNLKAIAFRGTKEVELADAERFEEVAKEVTSRMTHESPLGRLGTPVQVNTICNLGAFPTHYWQRGLLSGFQFINADAIAKEVLDKDKTCWNCPQQCSKTVSIKQGKYKGTHIEGPEYETINAFGGICEIGNIDAIVKANEVCDKLGLDTITTGNVIGLAMRAQELSKLDAGFPINFGDEDVALKLLEMIAKREGIGDTLAEGAKLASEKLGFPELAVHVKGMEPPAYDARAYNGMALSYGVGVRGADHLRSNMYSYEGRGISDRYAVSGKAAFVKNKEDKIAIVDSMIVCTFVRDSYEWEDFARLFTYATGFEMSVSQLQGAGAGIINKARLFSTREGITRKDDSLPKIFHEVPLPDGSSRAHTVQKEDYERMLDDYYQLRGWDKNGIPQQDY